MSTAQFGSETGVRGEWRRQANHFSDRVTADGSSGYPVESGRYHLIVSLACPWAHRSVIVRRLLGLTEAISMTVVDPIRGERGWRFSLSPGNRDPISGVEYLRELYQRSDPAFTGRWTVPTLWDTKTGRIVTLYQVVMPERDGYVVMQGLVASSRAAVMLPEFRRVAATFRSVQ